MRARWASSTSQPQPLRDPRLGADLAATYTEHLVHLGFEQGRASLCNFRRKARDIDLTVHGDNFLIVADSASLEWMEDKMKEKYEVKCSMLGPEPGMK